MDVAGKTLGAFKRSSAAPCLVIGLLFLFMALSTCYHIFTYRSTVSEIVSEFVEKGVPRENIKPENIMKELSQREPEVGSHENALAEVENMEEPERTQYYWLNNYEVAGLFVVGTPMYLSFHSQIFNGYSVGTVLSIAYFEGSFLETFAAIFVHGVFELTGFFLIAAITLRAAWALWKALGHMLDVGHKERRVEWWRPSEKWLKIWLREIKRYRDEISELLFDFGLMVAVGALLIFLAGPIETHVSPLMTIYFYRTPALALAFLVGIAILYSSLCVWGLKAMRKDARATHDDLKLILKRRWRPVQLPFLMFFVSCAIVFLKFLI